jgi:hypothetical protein
MEEKERQAAFISALITEHTVLQQAASATVGDAAARSSLYVFTLSSSLVAMGFSAHSREIFLPFAAVVLPALFVLGVFTIMRLVDSAIENIRYLDAIARIRGYYRTLTPEAAEYFAADRGRWPEASSEPSQALGTLIAFLTTTASMIAFINGVVAGAGVTLLANYLLAGARLGLALALGVATAVGLMALFVVFQRWRFGMVRLAGPT